jgi:hypothetical protein
MKKIRLWFPGSLLAVCLLAIGFPVFPGGGKQQASTPAVNEAGILNPLGQLPLLKEKINLTMGVVRNSQVIDLPANYMTAQLEKDSNIYERRRSPRLDLGTDGPPLWSQWG